MLRENILWIGTKTVTFGLFEYDSDEGLFLLKKCLGGLYRKRIKIAGGNWDSIISNNERFRVNIPLYGITGQEVLIIYFDLDSMSVNTKENNSELLSEFENSRKSLDLMFKQKILAEARAEEFSSKELVCDEQRKVADHIKKIQPFFGKGGD